jgi:hypothetical protein
MAIRFHPHAYKRMAERGATDAEVRATIEHGEQFPARFGRVGFRRNFVFQGLWHGRTYQAKQVEAYTVPEGADWLVLTVIVRYF